MFKTLTEWITTTPSIQDDYNTWETWQQHQPASHFERSDIFRYYLTQRPRFQLPLFSCMHNNNSKYYIYCFGDFASLLVNPNESSNITDYLILLLDFYDICKGYSRRLIWDPPGIAILREVIIKRNLLPLQQYDFMQYAYPYNTVHAHTVTQYSLSTFIMRLVSHYMSYISMRQRYPCIRLLVCQQCYDNSIFGIPRHHEPSIPSPILAKSLVPLESQNPESNNSEPSSTKIITVPIKKIKSDDDTRGVSWPQDQATCLRCKTCARVTENIWGDFHTCLDCHLKRICVICGNKAVIIAADYLPRCENHQDK